MKNIIQNSFFAISIMITISSCAPTMPIMHLSNVPKEKIDSYPQKGTITVQKFKDNRSLEERQITKRKKSSDGTFLYSTRTSPEMNEFLKTTIEKEINESGLFSVREGADFELTGSLISIKNGHKDGAAKTIGGVLAGVGLLFVGVVYVIPGIVIIALNKDAVTTTVVYDAVLEKDGFKIWEGQINHIVKEKYPTGFKSLRKESIESGRMLDNAMTQSVREMIKQINNEVK
jgi:hypothetical protein